MSSLAEALTRVGGWRESRWLAACELVLVVALVVADIHRFVPFSKTPFYFVLGWVSLRLRGSGWRGVGFTLPPACPRAVALGAAAGIVLEILSAFVVEQADCEIGGTSGFTTKTRKARTVPLPDELHRVLSERKGRQTSETDYIFHRNGQPLCSHRVSIRFKGVCRSLGLNASFYSLRHSYCTWLASDGVSLYLIGKLAGHTSTSTTQVYSHVAPSELHSTVERLRVKLN